MSIIKSLTEYSIFKSSSWPFDVSMPLRRLCSYLSPSCLCLFILCLLFIFGHLLQMVAGLMLYLTCEHRSGTILPLKPKIRQEDKNSIMLYMQNMDYEQPQYSVI